MEDCVFDLNRAYGWQGKKMSLLSFATRCYFTNTTLSNGFGVSFDGTASGQLISRNSFYTGNKTGVRCKMPY